MIVLLESIHADALAMLEAVDEVHVMADPSAFDAGLARRGVRMMLTRGAVASPPRRTTRSPTSSWSGAAAPASTTSTSTARGRGGSPW